VTSKPNLGVPETRTGRSLPKGRPVHLSAVMSEGQYPAARSPATGP